MFESTNGWADRRLAGVWWLPDESSARVGGQLLIGGDGEVVVELAGGLVQPPAFAVPIVLGALSDGRAVTLEGVVTSRRSEVSSRQTGETSWESLRADSMYVGRHLPSATDRLFTKAYVEIEDLLSWIAFPPISQVLSDTPDEQSVRYIRPSEVNADLPIGSVKVVHWAELFHAADNGLGLRAHAGFSITAHEGRDLVWWRREVIRPLELFVTAVVGRANHLNSLKVTVGDEDVDVVYRQPTRQVAKPRRVFEFTVPRPWLSNDLAPFIVAWFKLVRDAGSSVNLYAANLYLPGYVETEFLNLVYGLEGYHRRRYPNQLLPKADHNARVNAVKAAAPEEHRAWLSQRLAFSNEPTLAARLAELLDYPGSATGLRAVLKGAVELPTRATRLRNMLAHQKHTAGEEPDDDGLYEVGQLLRLVLLACFLFDVGVSPETIRRAVVEEQSRVLPRT
jgi:ApeA N-terminal domain 1